MIRLLHYGETHKLQAQKARASSKLLLALTPCIGQTS